MTNAEKFLEVFGVRPDLDVGPFDCSDRACVECDCYINNQCNSLKWWRKEYKVPIQEDPETLKKTSDLHQLWHDWQTGDVNYFGLETGLARILGMDGSSDNMSEQERWQKGL